jgi:hypothetical protein
MPEPQRIEPARPARPSFGVRLLGIVLLTFSVGLVSCQAMIAL